MHSAQIKGEKYLVLKKKYRETLLEKREREENPVSIEMRAEGEALFCGPVHQQDPQDQEVHVPLVAAQSGLEDRTSVPVCRDQDPSVTVIPAAPEPERHTKEPLRSEVCPPPVTTETPAFPSRPNQTTGPPLEVSQTASQRADEPSEDVESKSESEPEDDSSGSMEPPVVALDPMEKEWMQAAASGRLAHLSQLLKQEPLLACKKTALHWAAKHGDVDMITLMVNAGADINARAGYTPLHIAALHAQSRILDLLIGTYGANEKLRDYSGHLASQYFNIKEPRDGDRELQFHAVRARERRNRKLGSLFHSGSTKKKWGSAEDLTPASEEPTTPLQLILPFRPRKFSR
ncbi:hypothetical protein JZ751_017942 [Albula glossodonta]|uniref:Ankyrin repeat domain-containing protein SOWAHC-like n=1 Tax=Albula glossodonta TaxID=121402 RepID=A0A8T2PPS9_9TELE|nr:hypothetical protein JZ751_017942 [Albula glossodonta]